MTLTPTSSPRRTSPPSRAVKGAPDSPPSGAPTPSAAAAPVTMPGAAAAAKPVVYGLLVKDIKILSTAQGVEWWLDFRARYEPTGRITFIPGTVMPQGDWVWVSCVDPTGEPNDTKADAELLRELMLANGLPATAVEVRRLPTDFEDLREKPKPPIASIGTASQPVATHLLALPVGYELLSANDRMHWRVRHEHVKRIKDDTKKLARAAKIPPLTRITVTAVLHPRDKRKQDADNIQPTVKAMVDALVEIGILPGDDQRYVASTTYVLGEIVKGKQLVLHLTEIGGES